jgi:hypothetical protein
MEPEDPVCFSGFKPEIRREPEDPGYPSAGEHGTGGFNPENRRESMGRLGNELSAFKRNLILEKATTQGPSWEGFKSQI